MRRAAQGLPDAGPDWAGCNAGLGALIIFIAVLVVGLVLAAALIGLAVRKKSGGSLLTSSSSSGMSAAAKVSALCFNSGVRSCRHWSM